MIFQKELECDGQVKKVGFIQINARWALTPITEYYNLSMIKTFTNSESELFTGGSNLKDTMINLKIDNRMAVSFYVLGPISVIIIQ